MYYMYWTVMTVRETEYGDWDMEPIVVEADTAETALRKVWDDGYEVWLDRKDDVGIVPMIRPATNLEIACFFDREEFVKMMERNAPKEEE